MKKKLYQQPMTVCSMMEPRTILCASVGGGYVSTGDPISGGTAD
jgi:hypothetical protein